MDHEKVMDYTRIASQEVLALCPLLYRERNPCVAHIVKLVVPYVPCLIPSVTGLKIRFYFSNWS